MSMVLFTKSSVQGSLPWTLIVQNKFCMSSNNHVMDNTKFHPKVVLGYSILTVTSPYLNSFWSTENYETQLDKFSFLLTLWASANDPGYWKWYKMEEVCGVNKDSRYAKIWLWSLHKVSNTKHLSLSGKMGERTNMAKYISVLLMWIKKNQSIHVSAHSSARIVLQVHQRGKKGKGTGWGSS